MTLLVVVAVLALSPSATDAHMCKQSSQAAMWKHGGGSFKKIPGTIKWREYNAKNEPNSDIFEEVLKEGSAIVIHDKKRNVKILLKDDVAGIQHSAQIESGSGNFDKLYGGSFVTVMDCTGAN